MESRLVQIIIWKREDRLPGAGIHRGGCYEPYDMVKLKTASVSKALLFIRNARSEMNIACRYDMQLDFVSEEHGKVVEHVERPMSFNRLQACLQEHLDEE